MKIKRDNITRYQVGDTGELCCTICGALINTTRFKSGSICGSCLQYVKSYY